MATNPGSAIIVARSVSVSGGFARSASQTFAKTVRELRRMNGIRLRKLNKPREKTLRRGIAAGGVRRADNPLFAAEGIRRANPFFYENIRWRKDKLF